MKDREYVSLYLRADQMHNFYKREEYDLLSYFGDLGGLQGIVMGLGYLVSAPLVNRLFKAALVEKNYRVQRYDIDDSQYYETKLAGEVTPENSSDDGKKGGLAGANELKSRAAAKSNFRENKQRM